jgi:hypothetical protein
MIQIYSANNPFQILILIKDFLLKLKFEKLPESQRNSFINR